MTEQRSSILDFRKSRSSTKKLLSWPIINLLINLLLSKSNLYNTDSRKVLPKCMNDRPFIYSLVSCLISLYGYNQQEKNSTKNKKYILIIISYNVEFRCSTKESLPYLLNKKSANRRFEEVWCIDREMGWG